MLYKLAHLLRDRFPFLWNGIEYVNSLAFYLIYRSKLKKVSFKGLSEEYIIREASIKDVSALVEFFGQQPKEAFTFFHPHGFNEKAIAHVVKNRAFLTFGVWHDKELVGYFFLRCFFNGKGYRGRMVDNRWNNKGIGKLMSLAINHIAFTLGIRMFSSISPENYASLASVKATCDMKVIKTLENGYFYIEILPQKTHPS